MGRIVGSVRQIRHRTGHHCCRTKSLDELVHIAPSRRLIALRTGVTLPKTAERHNDFLPNLLISGSQRRSGEPLPENQAAMTAQ
jgi:hypothetical protein